jgi:hypothetical protein
LPQLLGDIPLNVREQMVYQHDGAPPHADRNVVRYLQETFLRGFIGKGEGDLWRWLRRSADLTPLDFFLWEYVKSRVYEEVPKTSEDMKLRIRAAFRAVTAQMLRNVKRSFFLRLNLCLNENGMLFEHLI